jgi:hypothetical protein
MRKAMLVNGALSAGEEAAVVFEVVDDILAVV